MRTAIAYMYAAKRIAFIKVEHIRRPFARRTCPWRHTQATYLGRQRQPPPACADKEADCNYWAHTGECSRNRKWMSRHCALSCGACLGLCADTYDACAGWADAGECEANEPFMLERCPASCDLCPRLSVQARECDACLTMQEVALCNSYEWVSLDVSLMHHGMMRVMDRAPL